MWRILIFLLCVCTNDAFLTYLKNLPVFANPHLKVASFNIQTLGRTKLNKPDVSGNIIRILSDYDLVSVLELRDSSDTVADALLQKLNNVSSDSYRMVKGARLGRTVIKEAYLFFYKPSRVSVETVDQHPDVADEFERSPMTVVWNSPSTELKKFATLAIHVKPDDVEPELNALARLAPQLQQRLGVKELFLMGDLNSDCGYLSETEWRNLTLTTGAFDWLIPQHVDTTTFDTDCAYDNIIVPVTTPTVQSYIVQGSVRPVNLESRYHLTRTESQKVSDHLPLEFYLRGAVNPDVAIGSTLRQGFTLDMKTLRHRVNDVRALYRQTTTGFTSKVYRVDTRMDHVVLRATADSLGAVRQRVDSLHLQFPALLPASQLTVVERLLPGLELLPRQLGPQTPTYRIEFKCSLDTSVDHTCSLAVERDRI